MARSYVFSCDGCGHETVNRQHSLPVYWADVSIKIDGFTNWTSGGGRTLEVERLLCSQCQIRLRDSADPRTWPQTKAAE